MYSSQTCFEEDTQGFTVLKGETTMGFDKENKEQVKHRVANYGRTQSGYGRKIPTDWMVMWMQRWRRVYVMQYSNAGSAYIIVGGDEVFVDVY
jgi:hypothetical protein